MRLIAKIVLGQVVTIVVITINDTRADRSDVSSELCADND